MSIGPTSSQAPGFPPEEAVYRSIIDAAVEGIWIVNQDGRLGFANPAIARMLGYKPEEMYGRQATDLFLEDDREQASHQLAHGKQKWSNLAEIRLRHEPRGPNRRYCGGTSAQMTPSLV